MTQLSTIIEQAFENRANFTAADCPSEVRQAVEAAIEGLDNGTLRVAEKIDGEWIVHQWLKKAVLLSFKLMIINQSNHVTYVFMIKSRPNFLAGLKSSLKKPAYV